MSLELLLPNLTAAESLLPNLILPNMSPPILRHFAHADQAKLHLYGENKDIYIGDINSR